MDNKKVAIIGDGGRIRLVDSSDADGILVKAKPLNYVVVAPGTPVHFADGIIVNMNRAERRRRGLYGSMVTRVKGKMPPPNIRKDPV